ncbi:HAD family hydrolase [Erysipelothrix sp. HDW6C]|uniref:HAD family hydrolase n=1 Tax=Erysipelothrix sp. HDW6C TaxID=2714930 RepID=UPI0014097B0D|nr:HAD family hydrolase [Erysipelothrix sp. HDW6C]QIK70481.1 HAD family hydrolase [Erysipelothrix sp. HDW6C]
MAVIFDLDGTLMDTIADMGNSLNRVLEGRNLPTHTLATYKTFVGNGIKKLVERALPEDYDEFDDALEEFLADYGLNYSVDSTPYPGVVETLKELNTRGIPVAICTNKKQVYTDGIVAAYFGDIDFVTVIGDQFDGNHKPSPHYPLIIAEEMGINPENILFVGDSDVDMNTAKNANMIPIGVSWGFRPVSELEEHGAKHILDRMDKIIELI